MYEKLDSLFFFLCLSHSLSLCSCLALLTVSVSHSVFKVCSAEEKKLWRTSLSGVGEMRAGWQESPRGISQAGLRGIRSAGFVDGFSVHYPLLSSSSLAFTHSLYLYLSHARSLPLCLFFLSVNIHLFKAIHLPFCCYLSSMLLTETQ